MSTTQEEWQQWFQDVWAHREDKIYRELFGQVGPNVHTIPPELFRNLGFPETDPRWHVHGVFEVPPNDKATYWTYVTTALSNPWGQDPATAKDTDISGLGIEMVIHTPKQSPWAIQVLHWLMAVNILTASDLLRGEIVSAGGRIPLHTGIDPKNPDSLIRNLVILEADHLVPGFTLPSGTVDLLLCLGLTDSEMELASRMDYDEFVQLLRDKNIYPITDARRSAITV